MAVLNQLDELEIKDAIVLGDIVGYSPHPMECIRELQSVTSWLLKATMTMHWSPESCPWIFFTSWSLGTGWSAAEVEKSRMWLVG